MLLISYETSDDPLSLSGPQDPHPKGGAQSLFVGLLRGLREGVFESGRQTKTLRIRWLPEAMWHHRETRCILFYSFW